MGPTIFMHMYESVVKYCISDRQKYFNPNSKALDPFETFATYCWSPDLHSLIIAYDRYVNGNGPRQPINFNFQATEYVFPSRS